LPDAARLLGAERARADRASMVRAGVLMDFARLPS